MDGIFRELESGAEYYVRHLADGALAWAGEQVPAPGASPAFVNVFLGTPSGPGTFRGNFIDVPKGRTSGIFRDVIVHETADGFHFDLPGAGRRTLLRSEDSFAVNACAEAGCGFYDTAATEAAEPTLTGVWRCDDGGTYYVRQFDGNRVAWFAEHRGMAWCHVFFGQIGSTGIVSGRWIDLPKAAAHGAGVLGLAVSTDPLSFPLGADGRSTIMTFREATAAFGGRTWTKTDTVRVAFRLETLTLVRNADIGGVNVPGDEPYLMPAFVTLSGNEYTNLISFVSPRGTERPRVESPLFTNEWGTSADWPKNNLTWQEDLAPGTVLNIPDHVGYGEMELRSLPGLQPNSRLGRDGAMVLPGIVAMEEASSRNDDIRAAYHTILDRLPGEVHAAASTVVADALAGTRTDVATLITETARRIRDAAKAAAIASATSDLGGVLSVFDPDKVVGVKFPSFTLGQLKDQCAMPGASIAVIMNFAGGDGGRWTAAGTISAQLGPARFAGEIVELQVTLQTGEDDKRFDSAVELSLEEVGGIQGPFAAHGAGATFTNGSLQVCRLKLPRPTLLGNQRRLMVNWQRGPGSWSRNADSWDLKRIRVVAFDRLNRRRVLVNARDVNLRFDGDRRAWISLPPG